MSDTREEVPEPLRRLGVTRREATVLAEVVDRRRNPEIAERLVISIRTVESHIASLLRKLAADDRDALVVRADELLSLHATPLPTPSTPFVGRRQELQDLPDLLTRHRLVTLVGPGGAGKTRLALRLAHEAASAGSGGHAEARFADLSAASAEEVWSVLADALGVHAQAREPGPSWREAVRELRGLVVVDNCEHVIEVAARHVDELLGAARGLTILATSREALRIPQEQVVPVSAMVEADELFEQRARAADPTFRRTEANAAAIVELCERLDQLPLAIELAAARMATFDLDQVVAQLNDRFSLLVDGPRNADARQRTLEACLDWSHDLLDEDERRLLHRLAVFPTSFTWEAAVATCVDEELPAADILTALPRLVDKSLVMTLRDVGGKRFLLTESVRLYALRRAALEPDVADRHAAHFLALASRAAPELRGPGQPQWLPRLQVEQANLVAALDRLINDGAADDALTMATALSSFWDDTGRTTEARAWMDRALSRADEADRSVHARARIAASTMSRTVDVQQARAHAEVARELSDDDPVRALADAAMGWALAYDGEADAAADHLGRALDGLAPPARSDDHAWDRATVLQGLALATPDLPRALELARAAQHLFHVAGDRRREANTLYTMASRALDAGVASDDVGGWLRESLRLATAADSSHDRAHAELGLARLGWARGEDAEVVDLLGRCLPSLRQLGDLRCVGRALLLSADVARLAGDVARETELLRQSLQAAEPAADHRTAAAATERLASTA